MVDYRLCQSYTTLTKLGKTLDPKALAILAKAAGSTTPATIAAYCAALPVPPNPCLAQPVPTASASPSATPTDKNGENDKDIKGGDWWRWCGICPKATATSSATPTASATATAVPGVGGIHRFPLPWFWCGDRDPKATHSPKPTTSAKPTPTKSPFPDHNWWGFGPGKGSNGNGSGNDGQGAGTDGGVRNGTPVHAIQGADSQSGKDAGQRH